MPELMVALPQTTAQNVKGGTNGLEQSDAAGRPGEASMPDAENGADASFAAVLKSKVDVKNSSPETDAAQPEAAATSATAPGSEAIVVDLSALLPFLGINSQVAGRLPDNPAGTPTAATHREDDLPGVEMAMEHVSAELPPALPAPTAATQQQPGFANTNRGSPTEAPPRNAPGLASATLPESQLQMSGKIAPDAAAISADAGGRIGEKTAPEAPTGGFQILLERAGALSAATMNGPVNTTSTNPALRIDTPLAQPGWHEEVGQKLTWMVGNDRHQADLVLTPPQLGRVEVSLTLNGDQATAVFTSANPAVREALENSLHRLREVLADAGVSLGQTQVGSESPNQSARDRQLDPARGEAMRYASPIPEAGAAIAARSSAGRGMIDTFA